MKVSDTKILAKIMDDMGIEYSVLNESYADVYADLNFSKVAEIFAKENCTIFTMEERDESLESFYLSLIGGEEHA